MLGGWGGMGFIFEPETKAEALDAMQEIMLRTKWEMEDAMPFAMDPVVYNFSINEQRSVANFCRHSPSLGDAETNQQSETNGCPIIGKDLEATLQELGYDLESHKAICSAYKTGEIGVKQNRLSIEAKRRSRMSNQTMSFLPKLRSLQNTFLGGYKNWRMAQ